MIETLPAFKRKKCRMPYLIDLVQDNVRSRIIYPIIIFVFFIFIVHMLKSPPKFSKTQTYKVKPDTPFNSQYNINEEFQNSFPMPRVRMSDQNGPLKKQEVKLVFKDLIIPADGKRPNCDFKDRQAIAGSLEFLRLAQVCKVEGKNLKNKTDDNGRATFSSVKIIRAPQGNYGIRYELTSKTDVMSDELPTFLNSKVAKLEVLKPYSPQVAETGVAFIDQPAVRVFDMEGNPIAGKYVVAFTWPEPHFSGKPTPNLIEAHKIGWLKEDVSKKSDANGYANFTALTIMGSNSRFVYIFFTCDGVTVAPWAKTKPQTYIIYGLPYYIPPIKIISSVEKLEIFLQPSSSVIEGEVMAAQPIIKVLDKQGNGIPYKLVFASISYVNGPLPFYYRNKRKGYLNKELIKPIPGQYAADYLNPLFMSETEKPFEPLYTDQEGYVSFSGMYFSVYGAYGQFKITFRCDGVYVESQKITVSTSVKKIKFYKQPAHTIDVEKDQKLNPIVQILGKSSQGIFGKTPEIKVMNLANGEFSKKELNLELDSGNAAFEPSDDDGFSKLFFKLTLNKENTTHVILQINVDGVRTNSRPFKIIRKKKPKSCGSIAATEFPPSITTDELFTASFKVFSTDGKLRDGDLVSIEKYYSADGPTQIPQRILPGISKTGFTKAGEVTFSNLKLDFGPSGKIYFRGKTMTILSTKITINTADMTDQEIQEKYRQLEAVGNVQICYTSFIPVIIMSKIEKIDILNYPIQYADYGRLVLKEEQVYEFELLVYGFQRTVYSSRKLKIYLNILEMPPYLIGEHGKNNPKYASYMEFRQLKSSTDSRGIVYVTIKVKKGNPGLYVINFGSDAAYSEAIMFKTTFLPAKITIQKQPYTNTNSSKSSIPYAGNFLIPPMILVQGADGSALENYKVIAAIDRTSKDSNGQKAILDLTDFIGMEDSFVVLTPQKTQRTNNLGVATLKQLSVLDVDSSLPSVCIRYIFQIGQEGMNVKSNPSIRVCFQSSYHASLGQTNYSRTISQNNNFANPLILQIRKDVLTDYEKSGIMLFSAVPYMVGKVALKDPLSKGFMYLNNHICAYVAKGQIQTEIQSYKGICNRTVTIYGNDPGPFSYSIVFKKLRWIQASDNVLFKLSLSTPLNYIKINNTNTSNSTAAAKSSTAKKTTNVTTNAKTNTTTKLITEQASEFSAETEYIKVTNEPQAMQIITQPPSLVFVGDIFQASILCQINKGSPVSKATVSAGVLPDEQYTNTLNKNLIQSMITTFSAGDTTATKMTKLSKRQNLEMDPERESTKTSTKGIANFRLRIVTSKTGKYTLRFQSGNTYSDKTESFWLINKIKKVRVLKDISQTLYIKNLKIDGAVDTKLAVQPKIRLIYLTNQTLSQKKVIIKIYPWLADYKLNFSSTEPNGIESLIEKTLVEGGDFMNKTAVEMIQNLMKTILNAGIYAAGGDLAKQFNASFTYPKEKANGELQFTDLTIQFRETGKFMMYFIVDGIESNYGGTINVQVKKPSLKKKYVSNIDKQLIVVTCILTLIANTPYHSLWWALMGCISCLGTMVYTFLYSQNFIWKWSIVPSCFFLLTGMIKIVYSYNFKDKTKQRLTFKMREGLFYEYVYQRLFNQASKTWITAKISKGKQRLSDTIPNPYTKILNQETKKINADRKKKIKEISNNFELEPGKRVHIKEIIKKYPAGVPEDKGKTALQILVEKHLFKLLYSKNDGFESNTNLTWKEKVKRIFGGFGQEYENILIKEAHFFPMRLNTGALMSLCIVGVICFVVVVGSISLSIALTAYQQKIKDIYMKQMSSALSQYKAKFSGNSFNENLLKKGQQKLQFITHQLAMLTIAIVLAAFFGSIFATFMFFWGILCLYNDFHDKIMEMRKGKYPELLKDTPLISVTPLTGIIFANAFIAFAFNLIISTLILIPVFWSLTYKFLWERPYQLLFLVLLIVWDQVKGTLVTRYIINDWGVLNRRLLGVFQLFELFTTIVTGIVTAFGRFLTFAFFMIMSLTRLDKSVYPSWVPLKDSGYLIYLSALKMHHYHNNPTTCVFANLLACSLDNYHSEEFGMMSENPKKKAYYQRKKRLGNKFYMCYLLKKNPLLREQRRDMIPFAETEQRLQKKRKKKEDVLRRQGTSEKLIQQLILTESDDEGIIGKSKSKSKSSKEQSSQGTDEIVVSDIRKRRVLLQSSQSSLSSKELLFDKQSESEKEKGEKQL